MVSALIFLAPQYHFGWAIANNVTLISAGYHDPLGGSMGSGIYNGNIQRQSFGSNQIGESNKHLAQPIPKKNQKLFYQLKQPFIKTNLIGEKILDSDFQNWSLDTLSKIKQILLDH